MKDELYFKADRVVRDGLLEMLVTLPEQNQSFFRKLFPGSRDKRGLPTASESVRSTRTIAEVVDRIPADELPSALRLVRATVEKRKATAVKEPPHAEA